MFVTVEAMIDPYYLPQYSGRSDADHDWVHNTGIVDVRERQGSWTKAIVTMIVLFTFVALCSALAAYVMQLYGYTGPTWTWDHGDRGVVTNVPVPPGLPEEPVTELV